MLRLVVLVCRVDDIDEDFPIVLEGTAQGLQIVVNLDILIYVLRQWKTENPGVEYLRAPRTSPLYRPML